MQKFDKIPILWIAAPVSGLIIQPVIGYFSDRTWTRLGRRRPYFLIGAILSSLALFVMPNSPTLWIAAGTLWIMDASINVSMEPFRAFVGDNLPDEQRALGFVMQSFFIGTGAVVGSILPYLFTNVFDVSNVAPKGIIPDAVKWSFYIGGIVFLLSVLWTVFKSTEYTPEELHAFEANNKKDSEDLANSETESGVSTKKQLLLGLLFAGIGALISFLIFENNLAKELYILFVGLIFMGVLFVIASQLRTKKSSEWFYHNHDRFIEYAKNDAKVSLGSIFLLVCAFLNVDLYNSSSYTAYFWHYRHNFKNLQ
ncbi:hypothetical protein AAFH68_09620 [Flavobacterium sp. CGRL1]